MSYLTGKRFEMSCGNSKGVTTGVIISEPYRDPSILNDQGLPVAWATCVAILWDDGSMEGCIDIEHLQIIKEDAGYILRAIMPENIKEGDVKFETYKNGHKISHSNDNGETWTAIPVSGVSYIRTPAKND